MSTDTSARALDALGDPTRRAILDRLREHGAMAAGDVAAGFAVSRPAVSQHLAVLRDAGLVRVRPEGTRRVYSLDPAGLTALRAWVEGFWTVVLADYADEVRRRTTSTPGSRSRKGNAPTTTTRRARP